ncbi:hypothetical protein JYB87_10850 [Shewanella avicenniae]|uniref:PH domain-containing protein n=1 Tax=Shewanella avicenniae TaxID=2814294 RepID=A0ABX7QML6_9GAMM|nr:hypothetical protein [Shewanella avicenniae]QSX32272.1 hypothetical protein JYB87_10850 [Shewanella avicenniae]
MDQAPVRFNQSRSRAVKYRLRYPLLTLLGAAPVIAYHYFQAGTEELATELLTAAIPLLVCFAVSVWLLCFNAGVGRIDEFAIEISADAIKTFKFGELHQSFSREEISQLTLLKRGNVLMKSNQQPLPVLLNLKPFSPSQRDQIRHQLQRFYPCAKQS